MKNKLQVQILILTSLLNKCKCSKLIKILRRPKECSNYAIKCPIQSVSKKKKCPIQRFQTKKDLTFILKILVKKTVLSQW